MREHYSDSEKEEILDKYKKLFEEEKVLSMNEFINRQDELLDMDRELKYSTFYKWANKREDIKNLKADPVQETKYHKSYKNRQEEEQEKEEDPETEEEENLELEKRIEEVDRIKTKNPESKENQKEEKQEITEKVKSKVNPTKLYIAGGVLIFGIGSIFLMNKLSTKKKEVENDVQSRRIEQEKRAERQQKDEFSRYSTPADY